MSATAQTRATHVTPEAILQLGLAFWGSKTLLSAVELGVFSELSAGPLAQDELAVRLGLHPRSARDFLDALVALGMLEREDGRYANTAATELFLDRAKPSYLGGLLEMANARLYPFWGRLTEALRTGEPQNEATHRRRLLRRALRRPRAPTAVPPGDDRPQRRRRHGDRRRVPVGPTTRPSRHRLRPGRRARPLAQAHEHLTRRRLRPARRGADLRGVRRRVRRRRPPALPRGRLLRRPAPAGRRGHDGPHPPRLGPRGEDGAARRRPTRAAATAAP